MTEGIHAFIKGQHNGPYTLQSTSKVPLNALLLAQPQTLHVAGRRDLATTVRGLFGLLRSLRLECTVGSRVWSLSFEVYAGSGYAVHSFWLGFPVHDDRITKVV